MDGWSAEQAKAQFRRLKGDAAVFCAACQMDNIPVRFTYRCFDCGRWYCEMCMAEHIGRTRDAHGWVRPQRERRGGRDG